MRAYMYANTTRLGVDFAPALPLLCVSPSVNGGARVGARRGWLYAQVNKRVVRVRVRV